MVPTFLCEEILINPKHHIIVINMLKNLSHIFLIIILGLMQICRFYVDLLYY